MAEKKTQKKSQHRVSKPQHKKLSRLPDNSNIRKRPLLRPAIPSPYSGAQHQKTVYISAKTSFFSAVKRVEKLLDLADKRLVRSATTLAKEGKGKGHGKRKRGGEEDEIAEIAETVESLKKGKNSAGEEVAVRGTGKAIQKVLELGLWFQQREEYAVRLVTGSVGAVDDIEVDEVEDADSIIQQADQAEDTQIRVGDEENGERMDVGSPRGSSSFPAKDGRQNTKTKPTTKDNDSSGQLDIPETRIRYTSSLEVYISHR